MMRRVLSHCLALLVLAAQHANAAIGTPVEIGALVANSSGTTVNMAATAACAPGNYAFSFIAYGNTAGTFTFSDVRGNTWSTPPNDPGLWNTNQHFRMGYSRLTTGIQIGDNITISWSFGSVASISQAFCVSGLASANVLDVQGSTAGGNGVTGASPPVAGLSSGSLSQASELLWCMTSMNAFLSSYTTDTGNGWSHVGGTPFQGKEMGVDYQIVNSTSGKSCATTFSPNGAWGAGIYGFKGAASAGSDGSLTTINVGN
jgi:hypothetical protein